MSVNTQLQSCYVII